MSQLQAIKVPRGVQIRGTMHSGFEEILTPEALKFLVVLHRKFEERRQGLLFLREKRQERVDAGELPTYPEETKWIREGNWKGPYIPEDLMDRRVEITGPPDRKMVINALNCGAKVFMCDIEDSNSPTWFNVVDGQINLRDAVNRTIEYTHPTKKKVYSLNKEIATLMVRPRGWHLDEGHLLVDGQVMSASLFDFGLYFFHNAANLLARGSGPYFYLPKMEGRFEARLWNDVFVFAQDYCDVPQGSIRATFLLEHIFAAFEMEEMLYELRQHSAGMNCGRWDYIFSFIKKFKRYGDLVLPDRAEVGMNKPFMAAYVKKVIQTCHKRGVHAMGGMAANIPVKNNPELNKKAFDKVRNDKIREVKAGHDGSWVAHPDLIPVAMEVFDEYLKTPNQIDKPIPEGVVSSAELLDIGKGGSITEDGLRGNVSVGLQYLEAWLSGNGCVPLHYLMEDAATAEISRSQIWQWIQHNAQVKLNSGKSVPITKDLARSLLAEEMGALRSALGAAFKKRRFELAAKIYDELMTSDTYQDFMTSAAYPYIVDYTSHKASL